MPPSEIRKEAREALKGKWGKCVCILLAYMIFTFILGLVEGIFVTSKFYLLIELLVLLISMPLSFGLLISFMKLTRGENVKLFGFLSDGFSRFGKSWGIFFQTLLRMILPIICIVLVAFLLGFSIAFGAASGNYILTIFIVAIYIATIIYAVSRGFLYVLAYYIGYDNPEFSSKACVLKSEALMRGNRGSYFLLELSFIGWAILACLSLGIGILWLVPYMQVAVVCFYERVAKPETKAIEEEVKIEE